MKAMASCLALVVIVSTGCNYVNTATEGEFRLVGGEIESKGRIELFLYGLWGTVSDYVFNLRAAEMVCRSLKYRGVIAVHEGAFFGQGTGEVWLNRITCPHNASKLSDCTYEGGEKRFANHDEDYSVSCTRPKNGDFRLMNGTSVYNGRVEVYYNGNWGTMCDTHLNKYAANMVCRQLEYREADDFKCCPYYGMGVGTILLDKYSCPDDANDITDCDGWTWGVHNCTHAEDASVSCKIPNNEFRLVGGEVESRGRIELFQNGLWGTVCGDVFNLRAAEMVCRNLKYRGVIAVRERAFYGQGTGIIWLNSITCPHNASKLGDCSIEGGENRYCDHDDDYGVSCTKPENGDFRLMNGTSVYNGRVEVYYNGNWGTVCDNNFTKYAADMVCRQLEYREAEDFKCCAYHGMGIGSILLDKFTCPGEAKDITDCDGWTWGVHNCTHANDAAVSCKIPNNEFRLVGGEVESSGRIELFHNGLWGTVCDYDFNFRAAYMVCRSLKYRRVISVHEGAFYGEGEGIIWLNRVTCPHNAIKLGDCSVEGGENQMCDHNDDYGVSCAIPADGDFRLMNGTSFYNGRVEVYYNGNWGTVCDNNFDKGAADMVCRQLEYSEAEDFKCCAHYGMGVGAILLDTLSCPGEANDITDCYGWRWGMHSCTHAEDVSVSCKIPDNGELRLVDGPNRSSGRVEVFSDGLWGSVCDNFFDKRDADMVCRSLRYGESESHHCCAHFGEGTGYVGLRSMSCPSDAVSLSQCSTSIDWKDLVWCDHSQDASVVCIGASYEGGYSVTDGLYGDNSIVTAPDPPQYSQKVTTIPPLEQNPLINVHEQNGHALTEGPHSENSVTGRDPIQYNQQTTATPPDQTTHLSVYEQIVFTQSVEAMC